MQYKPLVVLMKAAWLSIFALHLRYLIVIKRYNTVYTCSLPNPSAHKGSLVSWQKYKWILIWTWVQQSVILWKRCKKRCVILLNEYSRTKCYRSYSHPLIHKGLAKIIRLICLKTFKRSIQQGWAPI